MVSPDGAGAPASGAGGSDGTGEDRVFTVANAVTVVRLLCVPLFLWLLFGEGAQTTAAVLLGVLGATDWVDGQIARRFHQVSSLGKILDPAADRILVGTAVVSVMVHGAVPVWFGVATLVREVLVSGTVLALAALGARRIDVLWIGKAGTFGLMWAYPAFLLSHGTAGWQVPFHDFAWVAGGLGLALAWIAAVSYLVPARKALVEGRRDRRLGAGGEPRSAGDGDDRTHERRDDRTHERSDDRTHERRDDRTHERRDDRTHERMDELTRERMDELTRERTGDPTAGRGTMRHTGEVGA